MKRKSARPAPSDALDKPARSPRLQSGRIKIHPDGFGFLTPDDGEEDIYVSARSRGGAMDGDRVDVEWWVGPRGLEGRVKDVLERARKKITGRITHAGRTARLYADDPRVQGPLVLDAGAAGARDGLSVVAEITHYPEHPDDPMHVRVLKVLGDPNEPTTEVEKALATADVEETFPSEVERLAAGMPQEVHAGDRKDRADLREIPFTTIDPETARDFDDAVAIEALPGGGSRLWVAVADVSHYVREGSPLDVEALRRGCSIYLPDRAIPMLPEPLSAHICSLVPEVDRLAMVARIDFDRHAEPIGSEFLAAVIHSRARLDYGGVAAALGGDTRGKRKKYEPFLPALRAMDALAKRLRVKRFARGALDLDLPEVKVALDEDDPRRIRDVMRARRDPGERAAYAMIEEFMLAANEAVARSFSERSEDVIYRVHDAPDEEKLELFAHLAGRYGIKVDVEETRTPMGLQRVLAALRGHRAEKALSFQLLRSLKQATYDVVNVGHFGLASRDYLHFTSPIRRYPDLVAHRLLKRRLAELRRPAGGFPALSAQPPPPSHQELARAAADASYRERKAMQIERDVVDAYRAFFMRDRIGDVLEATVSGVTSFGVFVTLDEPFVEGLIRVDDLPDDRYEFDEEGLRLAGRHTGRSFALGDQLVVEVLSVSVATRRIDFRVAEGNQRRAPKGLPNGRARGRGRTGDRDEAPAKAEPSADAAEASDAPSAGEPAGATPAREGADEGTFLSPRPRGKRLATRGAAGARSGAKKASGGARSGNGKSAVSSSGRPQLRISHRGAPGSAEPGAGPRSRTGAKGKGKPKPGGRRR